MADNEIFDINDPVLPKWVKKRALSSGGFPYDEKMSDEDSEAQLRPLQIELVKLQTHLAAKAGRVIILFEGRDAAGKGGAIKAYAAHLNPRYTYDVALPKPTDRQRTQWYFQRYVDWFPAGGETILFDRSWYNRAGVEPVMGFCKPEETEHFLEEVPRFERMISRDGIYLFKFWISIGRETQIKRFHERRHDPLKQWKFSDIDLKAMDKWDDYSRAAETMFEASHMPDTPWNVVLGNDKNRARIELIRTVLSTIDYDGRDKGVVGKVDERIVLDPPRFVREHLSK